MKVLVVGYLGNMGRRYVSVLNYLNVKWVGLDIYENPTLEKLYEPISHIIIATPTDTHIGMIRHCRWHYPNLPILCEKPVSKNLDELIDLPMWLYMVNNYCYMPIDLTFKGPTSYNYYKSGDDGLYWDCIQLIGLANGNDITLSNTSPVWECQILGQRISAEWIDRSYISMVQDFLGKRDKVWGTPKIRLVHEKVLACQGLQ